MPNVCSEHIFDICDEEMLMDNNYKIIAVDFDGTLCYSNWPELGDPNTRWKSNADKMRAALNLEWRNYEASPQRIIEIKSKSTGKVRRTGLLTYRDKAMSILCGYTFSPIEEAYADRNSFAFRPGGAPDRM